MQQHTAISQRGTYTPSRLTQFLWWLSTAEKELLIDSVIDRNRYSIIGMSVGATWVFATLAWTYFFSTVMDGMLAPVAPGLFMGFIILTIDRALIKGITRYNKRKFIPLLFRGLLAITIGTFMAQPAVLFLFDREVKMQTSLDNEKRKMVKRQELDDLYKNRKAELEQAVLQHTNGLEKKYAEVAKARTLFIAETDGSGGSGKIGIKDIARAKQAEYLKLDAEYQGMLKTGQHLIDSIQKELGVLETRKQGAEKLFESYLNNGFLTRVDALNNLIRNNTALQYRYWLIVFILVLIELMPVIAKTLLPSGTYDEKARLREELEKSIANSNRVHEQDLKEAYNREASEQDREAIAAFFSLTRADRNEKIKAFSRQWKEENGGSFDGIWERMKKEILTKQEN